MTRSLWMSLVLLPVAAGIGPGEALGQRERAGGHALPPDRQAEQQRDGTEEGLPEPGGGQFGPQKRIRPGPSWRLGVFAYNTETGVVVTRVLPGSPAARVGFEPGDRIVAVAGYQVGVVDGRVYYLGEELQLQADRRGRVTLLAQNVRNGRLLSLPVQLAGSGRIRPSLPGQPRDDGAAAEH